MEMAQLWVNLPGRAAEEFMRVNIPDGPMSLDLCKENVIEAVRLEYRIRNPKLYMLMVAGEADGSALEVLKD